ncbi:MAG: HAMP domain-containing sensor histidine kinase [Gammaproteobacteria bacterium]
MLPLILVLISAKMALDRLAIQSREAVVQTVRIVEAGRTLLEEVTALERNARQFQSLGDPSLYKIYLTQRDRLKQSIAQLGQQDLHASQRARLNELVAEEQHFHEILRTSSSGPPALQRARGQLASLSQHARSIVSKTSKTIGREVETMRAGAAGVQHLLFWQAAAVIPAVVAIALVGTVLIARPMRRLEQTIRRLGQGDWSVPVEELTGPRDLEELGRQLDWLRVRLSDLDGQKTKFLRHVSHALKTPLAALREGAELLVDEAVGTLNTAQAEIVRILCQSGIELQRQIEELLNFSAIAQTSDLALNNRPIPLGRLVEDVIDVQTVALRAKHLRVEKLLDSASVNGDSERLRVVLDNVLSNAIKYSPDGGEIRIVLQSRPGKVVLEVQDQGPGIARDERDKVFHPFYQGRAAPSGNLKGTGLGLAIAQEFVKAHRGSIEVVDVDDADKGARLRVILPLEETKP